MNELEDKAEFTSSLLPVKAISVNPVKFDISYGYVGVNPELEVIFKVSPAGALVSETDTKSDVPSSAATEYPLIPNDPAAQVD